MASLKYSEFAAMLGALGFERMSRGSHIAFFHDRTETVITLPVVHGKPKLLSANLVAARFLLDAKGILPNRKWEEFSAQFRQGQADD